MLVAITGYAFVGDIKDGGKGVKIGLIRVQAARIAKKTVKESTRDKKGDLRYDGEVKRRKRDIYMCDTTVTGSNSGTSDKPKFSLLACFMDTIFSVFMVRCKKRRNLSSGETSLERTTLIGDCARVRSCVPDLQKSNRN